MLGFLIYLNGKIVHEYETEITDGHQLNELLNIQKNILDKQIKGALNNEKIEEGFSDITKVFSILNNYNRFYKDEMNSMTEDLKTRFMDLKFLEIMKKS